jgi:heme/copper-type cytochrome/quinol oxidase subunit 3
VFFFMLIAAFVYFRAASLAAAAANLNLGPTAVYTACLVASSFTMWRAAATGLRVWLGGTIVLGGAFLFGQGSEYLRLFHQKITISQSLFGTTFFTLTGLHGLHVLVGIVLLAILLGLKRNPVAVETVALYWYFVDIVWIAIFAIVYLWTLL